MNGTAGWAGPLNFKFLSTFFRISIDVQVPIRGGKIGRFRCRGSVLLRADNRVGAPLRRREVLLQTVVRRRRDHARSGGQLARGQW